MAEREEIFQWFGADSSNRPVFHRPDIYFCWERIKKLEKKNKTMRQVWTLGWICGITCKFHGSSVSAPLHRITKERVKTENNWIDGCWLSEKEYIQESCDWYVPKYKICASAVSVNRSVLWHVTLCLQLLPVQMPTKNQRDLHQRRYFWRTRNSLADFGD